MDISYHGIWGYHPVAISLSNTKEVLFLVNRPGNMPSHTGAAQWIDAAIDLVQAPSWHAKRICVRGVHADFFLTRHLDRWAQSDQLHLRVMDANVGDAFPCTRRSTWGNGSQLQRKPRRSQGDRTRSGSAISPTRNSASTTSGPTPTCWLNHDHVAEFNYQPTRCKRWVHTTSWSCARTSAK